MNDIPSDDRFNLGVNPLIVAKQGLDRGPAIADVIQSGAVESEPSVVDRRIGVVGAGVMGTGVSELLLEHAIPVVLVDVSDDVLSAAQKTIRRGLRGRMMLSKPKSGETSKEILARLETTTDFSALAGSDFVIENVTEDTAIKRSVYAELNRHCSSDCILIADTSCVPISFLASLIDRPERVIGVHFMNPAATKPMVEVIRGSHTSDATIAATQDLLRDLEREFVVVQDSPGFVSNRCFDADHQRGDFCSTGKDRERR